MISIVCSVTTFFHQGGNFAAALSSVLEQLGYENEVVEREPSRDARFVIVIGIKSLNRSLRDLDIPVFLYCVDVFNKKGVAKWNERLAKFGWSIEDLSGVLSFSPLDLGDWKKVGKRSVFCPLGYHPIFDLGVDESVAPSHDISFLGVVGFNSFSRRMAILRSLKARWTCPESDGAPEKPPLAGLTQSIADEYTRLYLSAGKIFLHIHRRFWLSNFPDIRVVQLGISNRCFMISEPSAWQPDFLKNRKHWLCVDKGPPMQEAIDWALKNPVKCKSMAMSAHEALRAEYRLVDTWRDPMKEVETWI